MQARAPDLLAHVNGYLPTPQSIQKGTDLYEIETENLVPEGLHEAELVNVRRFENAFGKRVAFVFRIEDGEHAGAEITDTVAYKPGPKGKLAELMRGVCRVLPDDLEDLAGVRCRVLVRHDVTKSGKVYESIAMTC